MKRKNTELEQRLINKGWKLTKKFYGGKHSEKVCAYEYEKSVVFPNEKETSILTITLNQKRDNVINYGITNIDDMVTYTGTFTLDTLSQVIFIFSMVEATVKQDIDYE